MGFIAGPDNPPVLLAKTGLQVSISITIAVKVFTRLSASAPASTAARAITLISVTVGDSLTIRTFCPAAFLTADVLLKSKNINGEKENNIALVFSNKASSLDTDRKHQESIQNKAQYFPSPAIFVYTLPNICIGEISIKYKLHSENSFFIFDNFNAEHLLAYSNSLMSTHKADQVLCGWVEFDDNNYEAFLYLVSKQGDIKHSKQNIIKLYNT